MDRPINEQMNDLMRLMLGTSLVTHGQ